jgi:Zn-dependent protease
MRDPFIWSIPLGRLFGITIRVHILYPIITLGLILRVSYPTSSYQPPEGAWLGMLAVSGLLLLTVVLHEFGHCFAARAVDGDASEILIWPLGGLANVDIPHAPRPHFITAAAGPAVNFVLCCICATLLAFTCAEGPLQPPWSPMWYPFRAILSSGASIVPNSVHMSGWDGQTVLATSTWAVMLARMFWLNWLLFWINVLLIGFPLDGGRMLQAILWRYFGYSQATRSVCYTGFGVMILVGILAIWMNELLTLCVAAFIYVACRNQLIMLEVGGEEGVFGYDFSQGYTSLERDQPPADGIKVRRASWWKRWQQARAAKKVQREMEQRESEERRLDELLEKVQRQGINALTDEERRFMKRVSDRYRNRN